MSRPRSTFSTELLNCAEFMRGLGWYESHMFGYYFISDPWALSIWPDEWTLGAARTPPEPGLSNIIQRRKTLAQLKPAIEATTWRRAS